MLLLKTLLRMRCFSITYRKVNTFQILCLKLTNRVFLIFNLNLPHVRLSKENHSRHFHYNCISCMRQKRKTVNA